MGCYCGVKTYSGVVGSDKLHKAFDMVLTKKWFQYLLQQTFSSYYQVWADKYFISGFDKHVFHFRF